MPSSTSAALTGQNGATYINDTAAHTPGKGARFFIAIQALTETVLDQSGIDGVYTHNWVDFDADVTIPAGSIVYGRFAGLVLVSGTCLAYHGN